MPRSARRSVDAEAEMNHLLKEDIVVRPDLAMEDEKLPVLPGPDPGFELDWDAIGRAAEAYQKRNPVAFSPHLLRARTPLGRCG